MSAGTGIGIFVPEPPSSPGCAAAILAMTFLVLIIILAWWGLLLH